MMSTVRVVLLAGTAFVAAAGSAAASLVLESWDETSPGALSAGTIPGGSATNDILAAMGQPYLDGYYGSQVRLSQAARVTYTFIGFEAAFANQFVAGGDTFDTETFAPSNMRIDTTGLSSFTQSSGPGLLDFSFLTRSGTHRIVNGAENANNIGSNGVRNPDFFASIVGSPTALTGNSLYLFLDDLGAGPDDDHDDMVVRVDVSPVPVPAAAAMFGTAIAGLGFFGLRRRS